MNCELCNQPGTADNPLRLVGRKKKAVHKECLTNAKRLVRKNTEEGHSTFSRADQEHRFGKSDLLTVAEAAHMLNVHPNTIRRMTENGTIKFCRLGTRGDRRFRRTDLEEMTKV